MKKLVKLILLLSCISGLFVFSGCKDFFTPLPETIFEESHSATEEESSPESDNTDNIENEEPPVGSSEIVDTTPPDDTSDEVIEVPKEDDNSSVEDVEPSEPDDTVDDVEPEEVLSDPVSINGEVVILENLKIEATTENADAVYAEGAGTIVTIESGYYDGGDNGSTTAVYAKDGAKVVINGGTFKAGEGCAVIYAKYYSLVEINGGFFEADGAYNGTYFVLNISDNTNAEIIVKGGTFVNFNPADNASENPAVNFVAEGYEVVSETQENGDVWYTVQPIEVEAE